MHVPKFTKLSEDSAIVLNVLQNKFVSEFGYVYAFTNAGGSKC